MEQIPPIIEVLPKLKGFWCRVMLYSLYGLLTFFPFIVGVWIGYTYDMWVGFALFLFLTLVSGVVLSKMRVSSIPPQQREMNYSSLAIIQWYLVKNICLQN